MLSLPKKVSAINANAFDGRYRPHPHYIRILAGVAGTLVFFTLPLILSFPNPNNEGLWDQAHQLSHFVLFFIFTLVCQFFLSGFRIFSMRPHSYQLLWVAIFASSIGAGIELVQPLFERSRSVEDMLRNLLGTGTAVCALIFADQRKSAATKSLALVTATTFTLSAAYTFILWCQAYYVSQTIYPTLINFEHPSTDRYITPVKSTQLSYSFNSVSKSRVLAATMQNQKDLTGIMVNPHIADWKDYRYLAFDTYLKDMQTVKSFINVHFLTEDDELTFYSYVMMIPPGSSSTAIDLDTQEGLRRDQILFFTLHLADEHTNVTLNIDRIWLALTLPQN